MACGFSLNLLAMFFSDSESNNASIWLPRSGFDLSGEYTSTISI